MCGSSSSLITVISLSYHHCYIILYRSSGDHSLCDSGDTMLLICQATTRFKFKTVKSEETNDESKTIKPNNLKISQLNYEKTLKTVSILTYNVTSRHHVSERSKLYGLKPLTINHHADMFDRQPLL